MSRMNSEGTFGPCVSGGSEFWKSENVWKAISKYINKNISNVCNPFLSLSTFAL